MRFPDGMRDKIADAAKESGRSMNAEIVARLQATFQSPELDMKLISEAIDEMRTEVVSQRALITQLLRTGATVTTNEKGELVSVSKTYPPDAFGPGATMEIKK